MSDIFIIRYDYMELKRHVMIVGAVGPVHDLHRVDL